RAHRGPDGGDAGMTVHSSSRVSTSVAAETVAAETVAAETVAAEAVAATTLVELDDVTKTYAGGATALRGVTLSIPHGEIVAIVGPSGSGKSTMLHLIGTLDRPSGGAVRIEGQDVARLPDRQLSALRARRIGFVFQQFHLASGESAL